MNDHTTKRCTRCKSYLPATTEYFARDARKSDRLRSNCKACDHAYHAANRERNNKASRAWREANAERNRERNATWRAANRLRRLEYDAAYRATHPGRARAWQMAHPERNRILKQNYEARKRGLCNDFTLEQRNFALKYFNNCCAYCGRQLVDLFNERTLALDHFVPLNSPDCPGTTVSNLLPCCHGIDGCNNSKRANDPREWIKRRFGKREARKILARIEAYFEVVR